MHSTSGYIPNILLVPARQLPSTLRPRSRISGDADDIGIQQIHHVQQYPGADDGVNTVERWFRFMHNVREEESLTPSRVCGDSSSFSIPCEGNNEETNTMSTSDRLTGAVSQRIICTGMTAVSCGRF